MVLKILFHYINNISIIFTLPPTVRPSLTACTVYTYCLHLGPGEEGKILKGRTRTGVG